MPNSDSDSDSTLFHVTTVWHQIRSEGNPSEVFLNKNDGNKYYLNEGNGSYQWLNASDSVDG